MKITVIISFIDILLLLSRIWFYWYYIYCKLQIFFIAFDKKKLLKGVLIYCKLIKFNPSNLWLKIN